MNALLHNLREYLIEQSWHIALLVLMVALLSWILRQRSAHVRYLLWLVVLAKCLVPPLMTVPLAILPADRVVVPEPIVALTEPVSAPVVPVIDTPIVSVTQPTRLDLMQRYWLVALWMGGTAALGLGLLLRAWCFSRCLLRQRIQVPDSLMQELTDLKQQFGDHRSIVAWLTPQASQPFVWGWWRGQIYLPQDFIEQTNSTQRQSILAHELAHIQRCDPLINLLQIAVQALFWFHPLVWWANLQIRREREKCCDEMAIAVLNADVKDYCNTIVDVLAQQCPMRLPLGSVAIAGPVRNIEERIKTMMNPNKRFSKKGGSLSVLSIVLFALVVIPVSLGITNQKVAVSFQMDTNQRIDLILSEQLLQDLSSALCKYSEKHDKQLPKSLGKANSTSYYSYRWLNSDSNNYYSASDGLYEHLSLAEKVEHLTYPYLAKQWTLKPDDPVAFDNRLLQAYGGTYVLMSDGTIPYLTLEQMSKWELDQIEVSQESVESAETDRIKAVVSKIQSGDKLSQLGKIILRYESDQDKPITNLSQLQGWGDDEIVNWAVSHVQLPEQDNTHGVMAYDLALLFQGQGTNVLYLDGQIEYANRDRLGTLGVMEPRAQTVTTLDLIRVPIENDVVARFLESKGLLSEVGSKVVPRQELLSLIENTDGCKVYARPKILQFSGSSSKIETGSEDQKSMSIQIQSAVSKDLNLIITQIEGEFTFAVPEGTTKCSFATSLSTQSNDSIVLKIGSVGEEQHYLMITVEMDLPDDLKKLANDLPLP